MYKVKLDDTKIVFFLFQVFSLHCLSKSDVFLKNCVFSKVVFRIVPGMKNEMSVLLLLVVSLLVSAAGEISWWWWFLHVCTGCCHPTFDSRLPLSGAVELRYAQLGSSVTLDPPVVDGSNQRYFTWAFKGQEVAWCNPFGSLPTKGNPCLCQMKKQWMLLKTSSQIRTNMQISPFAL